MATAIVTPATKNRTLAAMLVGEEPDGTLVQRALRAARTHLGMEIAYASEFVGEESVFHSVDAPGLEHMARPGDRRSLDDVYCRHILAGRLPELIPHTADEPLAMSLPITTETPIGAHVSVPLTLSDGRTYGMFCCLSSAANGTLNDRDLKMVRVFADMAAFDIERNLNAAADERDRRAKIEGVLSGDRMTTLYQPIWSLSGERPVGFEALSRFDSTPQRPTSGLPKRPPSGLGSSWSLPPS